MIYRKTTSEELTLILEEGEGYTLEFKQNVNADLAKELVAFANASGGRIFIGVDDNNQVVGCDFSNALFSKIETMAGSCDPPVAIFIEKLPDQKIIVIHVPEGANRPHRCTKGFYLRNGANSQKMNTADITAFIQSEGKVRFDQQLRMDLEWKEVLDSSRLEHFLSLTGITQRGDTENLLLNLGAGDEKGGRFYLNQTGILFFAKDPAARQPFVNVICALFKGTTKAYILDRKELTGNILENVEDALLFLKKHLQLRWEITKDSPRRREILELPEVALREAVINAVCHRDYFEQGAQVMVEIFDDRVEIHNPGGLPRGLPEKDFGKRSVCRNPNIAALLLRCDYIEKMGTGIERIYEALKNENCPPVKIEYTTLFSLVFSRPSYIPLQETQKTMEKTRKEPRKKTREVVLELIRKQPDITTARLAELTGLTPKGIQWQIAQLKKDGLIERVGPTKGGHWKVKDT